MNESNEEHILPFQTRNFLPYRFQFVEIAFDVYRFFRLHLIKKICPNMNESNEIRGYGFSCLLFQKFCKRIP